MPPASSASNSAASSANNGRRGRVIRGSSRGGPSATTARDVKPEAPKIDAPRSRLPLLPYGSPLPPKSLTLITPHLHSLLSVPSHVTLEMPSAKQLEILNAASNNEEGIVLLYSHPLPLTSLPSKVTPTGLFGMYCHVAAVARHKSQTRLELALVPHARVRLTDSVADPQQFSVLQYAPWTYNDVDPADLNDIVVAAMPLLPSPPVLSALSPQSVDPMIAELVLHRLAALALEKVGKHDIAGVRHLVEMAFVEKDLHFKLDLINTAFGRINISTELTASIEETNNARRLMGIEQQMEKMVRHQLVSADPNSPAAENDPDWKLASQIDALTNAEVKEKALKEFHYLKNMDPSGTEYGTLATYLDWLVNMPWDKTTTDRFNMKEAQEILDKSHFGLDDVKVKIMQLMANASRTGKIAAKPLLFIGPPGTGKTSFAKSIADALGRKFISLAGLTETSDLRGHRRTYASSLPGKIASEMRKCGSRNPVIVIDEIDKIEDSHRHKPIMPALLELLSPDQNKEFLDHYLDTKLDCSEVLFICTANSLETIASPLLNRLHVVELRAYSAQEKIEIAKKYLLPQSLAETGLADIQLTDDAITTLIHTHSRFEAGVRQVRRHMQRLMRQIAYKKVVNETAEKPSEVPSIIDTNAMLSMLEAPERAHGDRIYEINQTPVGVVNGLAKNLYGGSTLTIEAIIDNQKTGKLTSEKAEKDAKEDSKHSSGRPGVEFTGNIMDTMKESSSIAYTYAKSFMVRYFPESEFFKTAALHVHVPFAQVKKDGPSAGCALVCAYLSVALGKPLSPTLCMTGEITLNGRVTAVGGIREKVTAAVQNGMTDVIIPMQNKPDFDGIPADLVENIRPHFVNTYEEAFKVAFNIPLGKADVKASQPSAAQKIVVYTQTPDLKKKLPKPAIEVPKIKEKRSRTPILDSAKNSL